ncbi:MAG: DUF21 domain-containing protein [Planctomycetes bacterium]|nr:DUF21 domain-containing protein [Planctomycetota bacterium]
MMAQSWPQWTACWVVLAAAIILNSLYCGLETGIYVLNKVRLDLRAEKQDRRARLLRRLLARPDVVLAVLLIGTNLAGYAATFCITTMFVLAGRRDGAEWYALAVATPVLFILCDSVPKHVFQRRAESLTYRLAGLLEVSRIIFTVTGIAPLVAGLGWLVMLPVRRRRPGGGHRLGMLLAEGRASGVLSGVQSIMADRVMHIADVTLADVMVPMGKVCRISPDITRRELLEVVRRNDFTRLPVCEGPGRVVGVLDVYDVLVDEGVDRPADRMVEPLKLPAAMTVTEALYRMQRAHRMMAVVHQGGRDVGIVTIKDLVEEIVGELEEW